MVSDDTMDALSVKKTLLSLSQLRTFKMLLIEINCRGALNNIIDTNLNNGQTYMAQTITNMQNHKVDLKSYNGQILSNLYRLNDDIKQNLFLKDIRIIGSYVDSDNPSYRYGTTFDVIDQVMDAVQILGALRANESQLVSNKAYNLYNFIILNTMDDYLSKRQQITDMFIDSVNSEGAHFTAAINLCLILTPLLLVGIVFMLTIIIWRQYNIEQKHMLAFIRLKPKSVKDVLRRVTIFKTNIVEKDSNKFKEWLESIEDLVTTIADDQQERSDYKKHDTQVIDKSETRARYIKYIARVAFYIMILMAVMLWNFISAQNSAKIIYRRQDQLEFANHLSEIISVVYCSVGEMFESNNTHPVKGGTALEAVVDGLAEIKSLQSQIASAFEEEDGTYDPTIQALLFQYTNCTPYNFAPLHLYFCNYLLNHGAKITLMPLVALFQGVVQGKISDYENCDKSSLNSLFLCAYINIDNFLPSFVLSAIEAQKIGVVAGNNLDLSISSAYYKRKVFLIAFAVSIGIVSILIWFQILNKLRDVQNDFKKVLQIFPPRLILSSFLLKKFLMQHTKAT